MDVSIILCTYNCEERVELVVESILESAKLFPGKLEIIIVDNNSVDDTLRVLENINFNSVEFKILQEKKQGLIYSRTTGIHKSNGYVGIFIDDDNIINKYYIKNAYMEIISNEKIYALGCQILPKIDGFTPPYLYNYGGDYAIGIQSLSDGLVNERGYLWGAGMVTRLDKVRLLYSKLTPILTGRLGNEKTAGEDGELIKWLRIIGGDIAFSSKLEMHHIIPSSRLTIDYLRSIQTGFKKAIHIQRLYDLVIAIIAGGVSIKYRLKAITIGIYSLVKVDLRSLMIFIVNIKILYQIKK